MVPLMQGTVKGLKIIVSILFAVVANLLPSEADSLQKTERAVGAA